MAFQCSYAGVPFLVPTKEVEDWTTEYAPQVYADEYAPPSYRVSQLGTPQWPSKPCLRYGDFFYPTHMARWAQYRGIVTTSQLQAMESIALIPGSGSTPQTFILRSDSIYPETNPNPDGTTGVQTPLYMLPARSLGVVSGGSKDGLWEVNLVDERFYYHYMQAGTITPPDGTMTWATYITNLFATGLGLGVTVPTIPSAYGVPEPDSALSQQFGFIVHLIDAALANVGLVAVRDPFSGTYVLVGVGDTTAWIAYRPLFRCAGGGYYDRTIEGLIAAVEAILPAFGGPIVPAYIKSHSYATSTGGAPKRVTRISEPYPGVSNQAVGLSTLTVSDTQGNVVSSYAGINITGVNALLFSDTARIYYDNTGTVKNQSDLTALATQMFNDFCAYAVGAALDETYPGILNWPNDSLHDFLWTYRKSGAFTRVVRKPWFSWPSEFQHRITTGNFDGANSGPGVEMIMVDNATPDASGRVAGHIVVQDPDSGFTFLSLESVFLENPNSATTPGFLAGTVYGPAKFVRNDSGTKVYAAGPTTQSTGTGAIAIKVDGQSPVNSVSTMVLGLLGTSDQNWTVTDLLLGSARVDTKGYNGAIVVGLTCANGQITVTNKNVVQGIVQP